MTPNIFRDHQMDVAEASRKGDMLKLYALNRLGAFSLQGVEGHDDLADSRSPLNPSDFNGFPRPFPVYWSLSCVVQNKFLKPTVEYPLQTKAGAVFSGRADVYEMRSEIPRQSMSLFIAERVDQLHGELKHRRERLELMRIEDRQAKPGDLAIKEALFTVFQERYNATLHHLLCASAALRDPKLTRKICRAFDESASNGLKKGGGSGLVQQSPLFNLVDKEKKGESEYSSAAFVAMMFEAPEVIDAMLQEGWSPFTSFIKWEAGPQSSEHSTRNLAHGKAIFLSDMPTGDDLIKFSPVMGRKSLEMLREGGAYRGLAGANLHRWATTILETPDSDLDSILLGLEMGVYDIKASESYADAAERGIIDVIDQLGPRLDWSAFSSNKNPVLASLNSSLWDDDPDEMAKVSLLIMSQAVQAGRTDLIKAQNLRDNPAGDFIETPLLRCVENSFPQGVLFCLEHGANPDVSVGYVGNGVSALETADGTDDAEIATLIRSFMNRRAALAAMASLDSAPDFSRGVHP